MTVITQADWQEADAVGYMQQLLSRFQEDPVLLGVGMILQRLDRLTELVEKMVERLGEGEGAS